MNTPLYHRKQNTTPLYYRKEGFTADYTPGPGGTPNQKHLAKGDRFIPSRTNLDHDLAFYKLTSSSSTDTPSNNHNRNNNNNTSESSPSSSPNKICYNSLLASALFGSSSEHSPNKLQSKLLQTNSRSSNLHLLRKNIRKKKRLQSNQSSSSPYQVIRKISNSIHQNQRKRKLPTIPFNILDCPDVQTSFYYNLLDWSNKDIIAVGLADSVYLWDAQKRSVLGKLNQSQESDTVTSVSFSSSSSSSSNHLAIGNDSGEIHIWDVVKLKPIRSLKSHSGRIGSLAWNKSTLSSGSIDTLILHHDVRMQGSAITSISNSHSGEICSLKWSSDFNRLASGSNDNKICIFKEGNYQRTEQILSDHKAAVKGLAWCPWKGSTLLASGGGNNDMTIRLWNVNNNDNNTRCENVVKTSAQISGLEWSEETKELICSHGYSRRKENENTITVWKMNEGSYSSMMTTTTTTSTTMMKEMKRIGKIQAHKSRILGMKMNVEGNQVATLGEDECLKFWDISNGNNNNNDSYKYDKKDNDYFNNDYSITLR